ncbi:MAG: hypothetical protein ACLFUR_04840 [Candidatus Hadarchaeia archaeon]
MDIAWPINNLSRKYLIAIPVIVALIFTSAIAIHWDSEGSPVPMSMELTGGSFVRITNLPDLNEDNPQLMEFGERFELELETEAEIYTTNRGISMETSKDLLEGDIRGTPEAIIENLLIESGIEGEPTISIESMGSVITQLYKEQARNAMIATAIAMAIILFIALRHYPTVGSILLAIGFDFLAILGCMAIFNIPLSLTSMAGILLTFGYAVDTNILLTTNVINRKGGTVKERASKAMRTGLKMSTTSAFAMIVLNLVTSAPELEQFSAVLVIGILADMLNTWFLNSGLLMSYKLGDGGRYRGRI